MKLEHAPEWKQLSINHLEGRSAAFFCYGDGGGDELDAQGRPRVLSGISACHPRALQPLATPFSAMGG